MITADYIGQVLDWEISTLGDPLSDLAYLCSPWRWPASSGGGGGFAGGGFAGPPGPFTTLPSARAQMYVLIP